VPAIAGEEALVLDLLEHHHVFVLPGYFYDFPHEAWLVLSLIVESPVFEEAVERLMAAVGVSALTEDRRPKTED
jgi:aspartate/methionine/tyrosine aminotransferase